MASKLLLIVAFTAFLATIQAGSIGVTQENVKKCFTDLKITDPAKQKQILIDPAYSFKESACFSVCLLKSQNIIKPDGLINSAVMKEIGASVKKTVTDKMIGDCTKAAAKFKDQCDKSEAAANCVLELVA